MRAVLLGIATLCWCPVAMATDAEVERRDAPAGVERAAGTRRLELRTFAELTPYQSASAMGEYDPGQRGYAYGVGGEAMVRFGKLLALGGGVSLSALEGENTQGDSEGDETSGWMVQLPFIVELGFPNVEWGRFSVGLEAGVMHAKANNTYYFEDDQGDSFAYGGLLLGTRVGYVHWLSDGVGLLVNVAARAGAGDNVLYALLGARLGVSWRL